MKAGQAIRGYAGAIEKAEAVTQAAWQGVLASLGLMRARDAARRMAGLEAQIAALNGTIAAQDTKMAELQRAREAAEAANEAKTRFLASVSHEIRSPLNSIYGYAQLLERSDGQGAMRAAKVIRRSSEHLSNLVEGLLDISQVEGGAMRLARETIRFPAFLEQLIDMLEPQAAAKGLALVLEHPPALPEFVRSDPKRLRQVLINLLSNGIKFTDSGQITLKVHYRNELATFEVIDTGIGIAAADMERIFAPFQRSAAAVDRSGVGLGLAITQALVQIMGGDIRVDSEPGRGSRFIVRLMLSKPLVPPAEPPVTRRLNNYLGHHRTVLVIDDDAAHLEVLKGLLEPQGLRVLTAQDRVRGLALAEQAQPDLVLLDVSLGGDNGWDIARVLRERFDQQLRIVMLSGDNPDGPINADTGPANDLFVTKPFNFDALLDGVAQQLSLEWSGHAAPQQAATPAEPALPVRLASAAQPHLDEIERLVRIGHVRAIEAEIDAISALGPETQAIVEQMREHLDNFDLAALAAVSRKAINP